MSNEVGSQGGEEMKLFKSLKKKEVEVVAPFSGKLMSITEVPDPVFSEKMMGDGFAIEPTDGKLYSPIDGTIKMIFPTSHALGIEDSQGNDWLIHVGLETVALNGVGFSVCVSEGSKVKKGDLLMEVDLEHVKANATSTITSVVITNNPEIEFKVLKEGTVVANEEGIIELLKK